MIPFFRKIRKKLAKENKFVQYSRYAIGEIILVVIGILIALQVNNWNETKKDLRKEKQILKSLHQEFKLNNVLLDSTITGIDKMRSACIELMEITQQGELRGSPQKMDSLIYWALEYAPFNPSDNTYTEILNTGKIELIRNDKLRNALFEYYREVGNNKYSYDIFVKWVEEAILPYLSDHIALKNIDIYGTVGWEEKSRFNDGIESLINSRKFENIIDNNVYHLTLLRKQYVNLKRINTVIIEQTF